MALNETGLVDLEGGLFQSPAPHHLSEKCLKHYCDVDRMWKEQETGTYLVQYSAFPHAFSDIYK